MASYARLRSWWFRTGLKGARERWPLKWWWRFLRQAWRERRNIAYAAHRMHFDIDLRVRRLERLYGKDGAFRALARGFNSALQRYIDSQVRLRQSAMVD